MAEMMNQSHTDTWACLFFEVTLFVSHPYDIVANVVVAYVQGAQFIASKSITRFACQGAGDNCDKKYVWIPLPCRRCTQKSAEVWLSSSKLAPVHQTGSQVVRSSSTFLPLFMCGCTQVWEVEQSETFKLIQGLVRDEEEEAGATETNWARPGFACGKLGGLPKLKAGGCTSLKPLGRFTSNQLNC